MKAKEYYAKYRDGLLSPDIVISKKATSDFIIELSREVKTLADTRKCSTASAFIAIIREINQKYNAVLALFEKECLPIPLIQNGFIVFWKKEEPMLAKFL